MRFGVHLVASGKMIEGEKIARVARRAEELGYDSLWVSDHIVFPTELRSPYPYSPDGKLPLDPTNPLLEPFTVLSYAAAVTKTVKLGTSVVIIPYRDPIVTAKIVSSLDVLSNGRFIFGVGVGWLNQTTEHSYTSGQRVINPPYPPFSKGGRKRPLYQRGPRAARGDFCPAPCQSHVVRFR